MQTMYPIRIILRDHDAQRRVTALVERHPRFTATRADDTRSGGACLYEMGDDHDSDLARIRRMLYTGLVHEVFVTAGEKSPDLIIAAMRAGASEFLPAPCDDDDLAAALSRFVERYDAPQTTAPTAAQGEDAGGRIIHVIGGKGGVGATTVAVNLAVELAGGGESVALMDMRVPLGEVPLFLDIEYANTWGEAARDISRLDATFLASLMVRHASGLDILPSPSRPDDAEAVSADAVDALMARLRADYAVTVVDGNPHLDDISVAAMDHADDIYLVCVLSLPCLANVRKLLENFDAMRPGLAGKVRLVVNRHLSKAEISVREAEELLGRKVFWRIENDYAATLSAINQGRPLRQCAPTSPVARSIARLAATLGHTAQTEAAPARGILSRLVSRTRAISLTPAPRAARSES